MITLIKDATIPGVSEPFTVGWGKDESNTAHTFQASFIGSPTSLKVEIEGSIDGSNFACIVAHELSLDELAKGNAIFHLINKPVPVIRARISALEGGVSPAVSVYYYKGE